MFLYCYVPLQTQTILDDALKAQKAEHLVGEEEPKFNQCDDQQTGRNPDR
jgi:hypothetical protein